MILSLVGVRSTRTCHVCPNRILFDCRSASAPVLADLCEPCVLLQSPQAADRDASTATCRQGCSDSVPPSHGLGPPGAVCEQCAPVVMTTEIREAAPASLASHHGSTQQWPRPRLHREDDVQGFLRADSDLCRQAGRNNHDGSCDEIVLRHEAASRRPLSTPQPRGTFVFRLGPTRRFDPPPSNLTT
jgi:hypothetical protein